MLLARIRRKSVKRTRWTGESVFVWDCVLGHRHFGRPMSIGVGARAGERGPRTHELLPAKLPHIDGIFGRSGIQTFIKDAFLRSRPSLALAPPISTLGVHPARHERLRRESACCYGAYAATAPRDDDNSPSDRAIMLTALC